MIPDDEFDTRWAAEKGEELTDEPGPAWLAKGYCAAARVKLDADSARSLQWRAWLGDIFPDD